MTLVSHRLCVMPDTVKAAGLQYVPDDKRGFRRKGAGRGFSYLDSDGVPIRDREVLKRIKALVIPPSWTDVWICPDPNGHLQATGRDAKGRKQYRYHRRYRAFQDETKFDRLLAFSEVLPKIRGRVERDLGKPGLPREKVLATVVRLLEKTLIRIGSDVYARENRSYGLTTMRRRHVAVSGSQLRFEFRGKSGVMRSVAVSDRRAAKIVQQCQTLPGQELFQYLDDNGKRQSVGSGDINAYLREITGEDVTAKDFRTWAGTIYAAVALRDMEPATTEREINANIVRAIDLVAARLGNTRAVCRHYYVHPGVLDAYRAGRVAAAPPSAGETKRRRKRPGLRKDEVAVLQLLQLNDAAAESGAKKPPRKPKERVK
jgi:DNA topoisomerase-1